MTGGTLSVKGLPVETYTWQIFDHEKKIKIRARARGTFKFTNSYAKECMKFITTESAPFFGDFSIERD